MRLRLVLVVLAAGFILWGCGQSSSPTSPLFPGQGNGSTSQTVSNPSSEAPGHYLLAYQEIQIDPVDLTYEIVPVHQVQAHYNILKFLENGPCTNCVKVTGISPGGSGTKLVSLQITHPFKTLNLSGFDVRGIAMFNGTKSFPTAGLATSDKAAGEAELVNADGFTTLYNPTTAGDGPGGLGGYQKGKLAGKALPTAVLNGFKRMISPDASNTRNAFLAGDTVTNTYEIKMPTTKFVMGYAVDASWAPPKTKPVTDPMVDFGPEANCPEPWKIDVIQTPISTGLTDLGGQSKLTINVFSWAAGDFNVSVELPELFDSALTTDVSTGSGAGFTTYEVTIDNTKLAATGDYKCLITAINKSNPVVPPYIDLHAYQIINVHVNLAGAEKVPPVAIAKADPLTQEVDAQVHFQDNCSFDPDGGAIALYEWDWNNDGTFDETGADVYHSWSTPGTYLVQFRVTDDEAVTSVLDTPLSITIIAVKVPPIAMGKAVPATQEAGLPITFSDNGSSDPDGGAIQKFEWDWENDGVFDAIGASVDDTYASAGTYYVQLRVTDDELVTATLATPLTITVNVAKVPPVALAKATPTSVDMGVQVHFQDNGSSDPDGGAITLCEWDWDNNGTFEAIGPDVYHSWASAGTYLVQYRVTDDDAQTATLATPITITVNAPPSVTWNNTIKDMLWTNCGDCHVGGGGAGGLDMETYQLVMDSGTVVIGDPMSSALYTMIYKDKHYGQLSAPELTTLYNWILNGAPES